MTLTLRSFLFGGLAVVVCACSAASSNDASSANAYTGALGDAPACAVRDAYLNATAADLARYDADRVPDAVLEAGAYRFLPPEQAAELTVKNVGHVYVFERTPIANSSGATAGSGLAFVNNSGTVLLYASLSASGAPTGFSRSLGRGALGPALECQAPAPSADGPTLPDAGAPSASVNDAGGAAACALDPRASIRSACDPCQQATCCAQANACATDDDCHALDACIVACFDHPDTEIACKQACTSAHPGSRELHDTWWGCITQACGDACQ